MWGPINWARRIILQKYLKKLGIVDQFDDFGKDDGIGLNDAIDKKAATIVAGNDLGRTLLRRQWLIAAT